MSTTFIFLLLITTVFANPLYTSVHAEGEGPEFSYDPNSGIGPSDWGSIETFETCGTGQAQSPIDLPTSATLRSRADGPQTRLISTVFKFERTTENFELNCKNVGDCGFSIIDGERFNIVNIHFHSPSEHKLAGEQFPLEVHMVHISDSGELAVIGTFFRLPGYLLTLLRGRRVGQNGVIEKMLRQIERGREDVFVNMRRLVGNRGYVSYAGSLTTPPCTEGVKWFISQAIRTISADQVERYMAAAESLEDVGNNRPIQPLNGRTLEAFVRR